MGKYCKAGQATDDSMAPQCYVIRTLPVLLQL